MVNTVFERNMLAIASVHGARTSKKILDAAPSPHIFFENARDGNRVPVMLEENGKRISFHSRFKPLDHAQKLAASYNTKGFYVFLGMGAGYEIEAIMQNGLTGKGIIVEYNASILRKILETMDLTRILADRRLFLALDEEKDELKRTISQSFIPALCGDLVTVPLRARVDASPDEFHLAMNSIREAMDEVSDDYSVQAFFGQRWFSNIIRNLELASTATPPFGPVRNAYVTAAGPSLEDAVDEIKNRPADCCLIATDTSLNALAQYGIEPDAIVSIDCQHISYYHFLGNNPDKPVFIDLASPPTITRSIKRPYFFTSGHPLARYIASRFRAFPSLDTSGGNVTQAAVSLADYLGASQIRIYGADFSYPMAKTYARGTYIYSYFDCRQKRLKPEESLFSDFLYRNPVLIRENDPDGYFRYLTKPLSLYHERMQAFYSSINASLYRVPGKGVRDTIVHNGRKKEGFSGTSSVFASGPLFKSSRKFLEDYLLELKSICLPEAAAALFMDNMDAREKDIWTTLLPATAAIKRRYMDESISPEAILEETRAWSISVVESQLKAGQR